MTVLTDTPSATETTGFSIEVTNQTEGEIQLFDVRQEPADSTGVVTYTSMTTIKGGATAKVGTLHPSNHIVAMQTGPLSDGAQHVNFPVAVIGVMSLSKNKSFTVQKTDKDAMEETFRFIRYVSANPSSKIASQFLKALDDDKDQDAAVDAFFAGSASFKKCTMSTWAAVSSWQSEFLSAWQGDYYLYDASDNVKKVTLVAGVSVTVANGAIKAQLFMADGLGNWSPLSEAVGLTIGAGEVSEADPGSGGVSVALQPVWMNAVQSMPALPAGVDKLVPPKHVVAPTLAGTVNGVRVMGNCTKRTSPLSAADDAVGSMLSWLQKNVGLLLTGAMVFIMYKQWQEGKATRASETIERSRGKSDAEVRDAVDKRERQAEDSAREQMRSSEERAKIDSLADQGKVEAEASKAEATVEVQEVVGRQVPRLEEALQEAPASRDTDAVVESFQKAQDAVAKGDTDAAWIELKELPAKVDTVVTQNAEHFSEEAKATAEEVQRDVEESAREAEVRRQEAEDRVDRENQGSDDEVGTDETDTPDVRAEFAVGE